MNHVFSLTTLSPNHSLGDDRYLILWVTPMTSFLKEFEIRDKKKSGLSIFRDGVAALLLLVMVIFLFAYGKGVKRSKKHSYHEGKEKGY